MKTEIINTHNVYNPLPSWMRIDRRPIDRGEQQTYGYGYSRRVTKNELWRPATRYIRRNDNRCFRDYEMIRLMPGRYMVSDHGSIWDRKRNRRISYRKHMRSRAYLQAADGRMIHVRAYRLALANWIDPPDTIKNLIYYLLPIVNHRDKRPWNNWLSNLQYTNYQFNTLHSYNFNKKGVP